MGMLFNFDQLQLFTCVFFRAWLQYPPVQVLPPFSPVAIFPALGELAAVCVASFPALGAGCKFIDKFIRKKVFPRLQISSPLF